MEEDISDWIHTGNVGKLEELVLNGYADLLLGRTHSVDDPDAINFLEVLPQYQVIEVRSVPIRYRIILRFRPKSKQFTKQLNKGICAQ